MGERAENGKHTIPHQTTQSMEANLFSHDSVTQQAQ